MAQAVLQPALPLTEPVRIRPDAGDEMEIPAGALVVLVGPSGCGKSTFARRWFGETEVVSSDECRRLVSDDAANQAVSREAFSVFYTLLRARLTVGRLAVADATSLTPWSRAKLRQIAGARGRPVVAVAFDTPLALCLARQHRRERRVPPEVVESSFDLFRQTLQELPHEGYERLYVVEPAPEEVEEVEDVPGPNGPEFQNPSTSADEHTVYRYGDFPELFQDLDPEVEIDRDNPIIITRVLWDGNLSHVKKLVRMDVLAREFERLELPANVRGFWTLLLKKVAERRSSPRLE